MTLKEFKYDIAISLCKEDVDFARKLVKALNPGLKVFFYENNQEELINKSGPEKFATVFKDESRIVVILSREKWSNTFYTDIERNAIIDRSSVKNEGYNFLVVIPMVPGEIPPWYPSTRIYANPQRFTIKELTRIIEYKVAETGGTVKPISLEERYKNFIDRIEEKKNTVQLQRSKDAIQTANNEIIHFKNCVNSKIEFLRKSIFDRTETSMFSEYENIAYCGIGDYSIECKVILPDEMKERIVSTQDICISFKLHKSFGEARNSKLLENEQRLFYYTPEISGWSCKHLFERATEKERLVLYRNNDNSEYYDLTKPLTTHKLVDLWFQKLLSQSTELIERYLQY